jgi:hypothetical protein
MFLEQRRFPYLLKKNQVNSSTTKVMKEGMEYSRWCVMMQWESVAFPGNNIHR